MRTKLKPIKKSEHGASTSKFMTAKKKPLQASCQEPMTLITGPKRWVPHAYQKKAVKFLLEHACAGLLQDPGLGKTSETLAAITILMRKKLVTKTLIIAPLQACSDTWPDEGRKWLDFAELKMVFLHGAKKEKELQKQADIYLINPEGLEWLLNVTKEKTIKGKTKITIDHARIKAMGFDLVVFDELSLFKRTSSNRFKAIKHALGYFGRRWGLTGSPAANNLLDLFGQCFVLDQGNALGAYISHYRAAYFFNPNPNDLYTWALQKGKEQEIYKRIAPLMLSMKAEDYLEMPEMTPIELRVKLPEKAYEKYLAMQESLIVDISKETVTAATAAVASMKCRQMANGGIYLNAAPLDLDAPETEKRKREAVFVHDAKTDALEQLVEELQGKPLLVAYDFEHDMERIRKRFGDVPFIGGGVPVAKRTQIKDAWNRGELPLLFGHPQSIGRSLNLQDAGNHVCWYGLTWNYELYDQFNRRILRQGNKAKKVFIYHIVAQGTIDHIIMRSLKAKATTQNELFKGLKELAQKSKK